MVFGVLGPLKSPGDAVPTGKGGALLGLLLLHPNLALTTERLIDGLWGTARPRSAANLLQGYVSNLRRTIGAGRIRTVPGGYLLAIEDDELDSLRFRRLVEEGRQALD